MKTPNTTTRTAAERRLLETFRGLPPKGKHSLEAWSRVVESLFRPLVSHRAGRKRGAR